MKRPIYLDHNATTPPRPEVVEAMRPHLQSQFGNASSLYHMGQEARRAIDLARERVARLIGAENPEEIVFTGGGSEAINFAIKGVAFATRAQGRHIITSTIEHSAALKTCQFLEGMGWRVTSVGVDGKGRVDPAKIGQAITPETVLVSLMHANNEIGTLEPIEAVSEICRARGIPLHVDAVQSVGKIPVSVEALGVDLLSMSAHKFYGPKGVGALFIRPGTKIHPLIHGGSHERNRRAGTENVAGIVGMGAAAELAMKSMGKEQKRVRALRDKLEKALLRRLECVRVNGDPAHRLYNTSNLSVEAVAGESLIIGLDLQGICVSSGSACSSGQTDPSPVLQAIGLPVELAKGSVRFSLGRGNTAKEINEVITVFPKLVERLRNVSPVWNDYKKGLRKSAI
jgi:cysteine desulfurase